MGANSSQLEAIGMVMPPSFDHSETAEHHRQASGYPEMYDLCLQLRDFHISARALRRIEDEKEFLVTRGTTLRRALPPPQSTQRPCWEPPVLEYVWFETILEGLKEKTKRGGRREIALETEVIDNYIEEALLHEYHGWINEKKAHGIKGGTAQDVSFWHGLESQVHVDSLEVITTERAEVTKRYGKVEADARKVWHDINDIIQEKDEKFARTIYYPH